MTSAQFGLFLDLGAWVCAAAALLNLLQVKRRGNGVFILSAAFLVLGGMLLLMKAKAPEPAVSAAGAMVIALLLGDFIVRARQQEPPR